jgi:ubiquinone/menaquinone biosynthesis C-methylase UbiE
VSFTNKERNVLRMKITKKINQGFRSKLHTIAYTILTTNYNQLRGLYWNIRFILFPLRYANPKIHSFDYEIISKSIDKYKPSSILDAGCGSGPFFKIYKEKKIKEVVGMDISNRALEYANKNYPEIKTIKGGLERMNFPHKRFDLIICNAVLQHIPEKYIQETIKKLCFSGKKVYLCEFLGKKPSKYVFIHNYEELFKKNNFFIIERGIKIDDKSIANREYLIFGPKKHSK